MEQTAFYKNYLKLCMEHGLSPSGAAERIGFKRSMVTRWSKGTNPHDATIHRIATYFDVPVTELTKEEEMPEPLVEQPTPALSHRAMDVAELYDKADPWVRDLIYDALVSHIAHR